LVGDADFGQAQGSQLVEAFLNGEVEMPPMPGQFLNNAISQHDYESMSAGAGFKSDVNGAQLQIDGFAGAKCPFDQGEVLVAGVDRCFCGIGLREIGFQDLAAIQLADRGQRVMVFAAGDGPLLEFQPAPYLDAQFFGLALKLFELAVGTGPRMGCEILIGRDHGAAEGGVFGRA
jgi:hypothetical protein